MRILLAICFALLGAVDVQAFDTTIAPRTLKLEDLLPPPPSIDSIEQQRDMATVLGAVALRTSWSAGKAVADNEFSAFRFADVLGPSFTAAKLPITAAFLAQVNDAQRAVIAQAKNVWQRPRPFTTNPDIATVGERPRSTSYPSGHSHFGYVMAIVLAKMIPEKRAEIFDRGEEYGQNRIIAGVHYPSDVEASRRAATATAAILFADPGFLADLNSARAELRSTLDLRPE